MLFKFKFHKYILIGPLFIALAISHGCLNKPDEPTGLGIPLGTIRNHYQTSYGYKYDFIRVFRHRLRFIKNYKTEEKNLIYLQKDSNLIVGLNYKESKLIFYDKDIVPKWTFGNKETNPFRQIAGIMYFEFKGDNVTLFDFQQQALKTFKKKGALISSYQIQSDSKIYRIAGISDTDFLYTDFSDSVKDLKFVDYNISSKRSVPKYTLKPFFHNKSIDYAGMVFDGRFVFENNSKYLVFYCSFTGLFTVFDKNTGKLLFTTKTVDQTPYPKAAYNAIAPGYRSLDIKPNIIFFNDGCIENNKFYLLNSVTKENYFVVDKYNLDKNGKYEDSLIIPNMKKGGKPVSVRLINKFIYVLYENRSITLFKIV